MRIGSTHIYFNSVCLTIAALIFMIIVVIMYIKKDKVKSLTTTLYLITIILNILCIIWEFAIPFAGQNYMPNDPNASNWPVLACKIYMFIALMWDFVYLLYTVVNTKKITFFYDNEKNRFNKYAIIVFSAMILIAIAMVTFLDIEIIGGGSNNFPYTVGGPIKFIFDIFTIIGSAYIIMVFTLYSYRVRNINVLPLVLIYIFYLSLLFIEYFFNLYYNHLAFVESLIMLCTYFTIESQDNKLLYHYKELKEESERVSAAKTKFLINMSHEIRTPMNTILGFGENILHNESESEEDFKNDFESITSASYALMNLINNVSDISRLESENIEEEVSEYLLNNLIFEINSVISSKMEKDNVKFSIQTDSSLPKSYNGDSKKIFKSISNILLNAIEYTNYGEVKLTINGKKLEGNKYELEFTVNNSGHAMSYQLFEEDFEGIIKSGELSTSNMGIIVAKELIKLMHGNIEFINEKGRGTIYIVKLTQEVVDETPIGELTYESILSQSKSKKLVDCSGMNVLVVDDTEVNLKLAKRYLEEYNFNVDTVDNGKQCVEMFKDKKYDMIFLDKMMPDIDGVGTIKLLAGLGKPLPPIIALTANTFDNSKETYISEGYTEYLNKPIVFRELNRIIVKYFGKKDSEVK